MLSQARLTVAAGLALVNCAAHASAEFRWFTGSGMQGTVVAGVQNDAGSYFRISCVTGVDPERAVLQYEPKDGGLRDGEPIQVVVNGEAFHFILGQMGLAELDARGSRTQLDLLADRLTSSRAASFTVEAPRKKVAEQFSLKDARKALGPPRKTLIAKCR